MSEENVMDAVNAALGDAGTAEPETPEVETPETETPDAGGDDHPEGDETGGDDHPEVDEVTGRRQAETDAKDEEESEAETERGPDGKFKKKETEVEGEKPKVEVRKEKDPVNDPIPKDLKKETSERIRTLIDTTKTVTAERDQIKQDFGYLVKGIEDTGATPEQYGETLSWLALFNSNNPQQQEKALELVENVAERLATLLGKERAVGDPLAAHADLKDAVAKNQITAQYAKEIARTRNGQQFRTELTTSAQNQQSQQAAAAQELQTARNDLTALEQTLQGTDPQYEAKKAILVPALKPVFAAISPSQWKQKFQEAYKAINVGPTQKTTVKTPVHQPLRAGKQPAGGQTKAPSSMLEAISGALGSMGK